MISLNHYDVRVPRVTEFVPILIRVLLIIAAFVAFPLAALAYNDNDTIVVQATAAPTAAATSVPAAAATTAPATVPILATPTPEPARRPGMLPAPLDPIFPWQDWEGMVLGVNSDPTGYPVETWLAKHTGFGKWMDENRIRFYGWINPGIELTNTASLGTYPISYNPVANRIEMDQFVARLERDPDTVQQDHPDWGFRIDALYGVDYRWTTAYGWFSESSADYNRLNAFDNPEMFYMYYLPHMFPGGSIIEVGRVISLPDIEAQLAPQNYLYTHSLMFDWDSYTQTGVFVWSQLSNQWLIDYAVFWGDDIAPWNKSQRFPTGQFFVKYVSPTNKDSVIVGVDAYNNKEFGYYLAGPQTATEASVCNSYNGPGSTVQYTNGVNGTVITGVPAGMCLFGHDNLQQQNLTWYHKFTDWVHNGFEAYYLWTRNAPMGGTISNGPLQYAAGGGPGTFIPGRSIAVGLVDYLEMKFSPNDFLSFRLDYLNDPQGWRTGYQSSFGSITLGVTHHFTTTTWIRPELRTEKAFSQAFNPSSPNYVGYGPYDNLEAASGFLGTKNYQNTIGIDLIQWF